MFNSLLILLLEFIEIPIETGFYKESSIYEPECQADKIEDTLKFSIVLSKTRHTLFYKTHLAEKKMNQ